VVSLRYEDSEIDVTPIDDGWRVEYRGRVVESTYLEYAIAQALDLDTKRAIALATQLLNDYPASSPTST
jgi:hypothetical protein